MSDKPSDDAIKRASILRTMASYKLEFGIVGEYRQCEHGYHHPPWAHSCDGCWCEGERDRREYGWPHDTTPKNPKESPREA